MNTRVIHPALYAEGSKFSRRHYPKHDIKRLRSAGARLMRRRERRAAMHEAGKPWPVGGTAPALLA